jgi:hypothetical protein
MDVSFQAASKASPITTAELWVDGVRWVRQDLTTPQAQISIEAGNNNGVSTGAFSGPEMRFASPGNGKRVQGTVDITIDAKARNGQEPYVTFYVDKQFKTLKNYPPYTLSWDSTQVPNGFHTIEAMGYLDSVNSTTTTKLKVYVDNPGGNTVRMKEIEDLRTSKKAPLVLGHTSSAVASSAAPTSLAAPTTEAQGTLPGTSGFAIASKDALKAVPETGYLASAANQSVRPVSPIDITKETPAETSDLAQSTIVDAEAASETVSVASTAVPQLATPSVAKRTTLAAPKAATKAVTRAVTATASAKVTTAAPRATTATPLVLTHRAGTPKTTVSVAKAAVVAPKAAKSISRPHMTAKAPGASVKSMPRSFDFNPLQVAFNGSQIAFDVQPRVEAGLPMAPFRQIFEHTGGLVQWVSASKVLRAVNSDREVVIKVGQSKATVNGETFKLDRAAFLEQGRTIVPLSFVGQALDVNVDYDPATGRLQITSK